MSRTRRVVINQPLIDGGIQKTFELDARDVQTAIDADYVVSFIRSPIVSVALPGGHDVETLTIWGRGIISFGAPTPDQIEFMKHLDGSDLSGFPGDFIAGAFATTGFATLSVQGRTMFDPSPSGEHQFNRVHDEVAVTWAGGGEGHTVEIDAAGISFTGSVGATSQAGFKLDGVTGFLSASATQRISFTDLFHVDGTAGQDQLLGTGGAETIDGGDGDDVIDGGGGPDLLIGGAGADDITAHGGGGRIVGGAGADRIHVGGNDIIVYETVTDSTARAPDIISGFRTGRSVIDLSALDIVGTAITRAHDDYVLTAMVAGGATLVLKSDAEIAAGDVMTASLSIGTAGNDTLTGAGDRNDRLIGGLGADTLTGGVRHNTFVYTSPAESTADAPDTINQFRSYLGITVDQIDATAFVSTAWSKVGDTLTIASDLGDLVINVPSLIFDESALALDLDQTGTDGDDTMEHWFLGGRVSLHGLGGADVLTGTRGDDLLDGGDGDDRLTGYHGVDTLLGGDGDDTLRLFAGHADGGAGNDLLNVDLNDATAPLVYGWSGDTLTISAGTQSVTATSIETVIASGTGGDDRFDGNDTVEFLYGGAGRDTMDGGGGDDSLSGGDGDDILDGGAGADAINGGGGFDTYVASGGGGVTVNLAAGTATDAAGEIDLLTSVENAVGGAGADTLIAGTPTAVAQASGRLVDAPDVVVTGAASESTAFVITGPFELTDDPDVQDATTIPHLTVRATGGAGTADWYELDVGTGTVVIDIDGAAQADGGGFDASLNVVAVSYDESGTRYEDVLDTVADAPDADMGSSDTRDPRLTFEAPFVFGQPLYFPTRTAVSYYLVVADQAGSAMTGHSYTLNISVDGAALAYAPTLVGSALSGGAGDDLLVGGAGNDTLDGGDGIDTASYANAAAAVNVSLFSSDPQDTRGAGVDSLANIEGVVGSVFADTLSGNGGNNRLDGGDAADLLNGKGGNDMLIGGSASDTLIGGTGDDILDGGTNADSMTGNAGDDTYYVQNKSDRTIEAADEGTDTVHATVSWTLSDNVEVLVLDGSGKINGTGNGLANTITGNKAANTIDGGAGNDALDGGRGDDHLLGGSAVDTLTGGDGNDVLDGGTNADTMTGGAGDDTYFVQNGGDRTIEAANGGLDTVHASVSWTLADNVERLVLDGQDKLNGTGNAGDNSLVGNKAANVLTGGKGEDVMTGGGGKDLFVFAAGDTGRMEGSADRITDWANGDRIDLHLVDAKAGGGDDAFSWLGGGAFTHHAGELRTYQSGGNTFVEGDFDGDGTRDLKIRLDGLHDLFAADFVL